MQPGELDYVTIGHVTVDEIADDRDGRHRQPGGGAFYSALQAARLGLRVLIVTRGAPEELRALLQPYRGELDVQVVPAAKTTTFATEGRGSARRQRLLAWAGPIPPDATATRSRVLHLAPVARELAGEAHGEASFVGLTPQGLVRSWERLGDEIAQVPLPPDALPRHCDAVAISETERASCRALLAGNPPLVAVTAGPGLTTLHFPGGASSSVSPPRIETVRDDLGAGDVFAAGFFVELARGRSPAQAAAFGNAAAAVRIEGCGPDAIGDRAAIAAMLARDAGEQQGPAKPPSSR